MKRIPSRLVMVAIASFTSLGSTTLAARDKYTVQVPNGLAFSEL